MKKQFFLFLLLLSMGAVACVQPEPKLYNEGIHVTPAPVELTQKEGFFALTKKVVFVAPGADEAKIAAFFSAKIGTATGYELPVWNERPASAYIALTLAENLPVNEEGYLLEVTPEKAEVRAGTPQGLFYGMQTVMQLLPAEIESPVPVKNVTWEMPAVEIRDEPRFGYRGMHLDVCRHFASVEFIKKQLDVLALFKINTFHWHLTEDQAWRIEIKKYPRLTEVGALRTEGEGNTYGPYFYTQEQVKEVVAYAKERFIEVIPEVELPGHGVAAIAAYPELSCQSVPMEVRNIWGVANDVYCAGKEETFQFLEEVLAEVIPLFESDFFHIGGDECPKIRWKACPLCQARIRQEGLKGDEKHSAEERLQSYFVQRIGKFLLKYNKRMIGWDEILEGGLAPTATVMSWRGESGGIAAANMGHDVIMTPQQWLYLDKYQGDSKINPVTIGGYAPLAAIYGYEPLPAAIEVDKRHHILGAQGNMWNEYNYTEADMEYDIYPKILALAEVTWTPTGRKDYADFERRLENNRVRLDLHGIGYYIPLPEQKGQPSCNHIAFTDQVTQEFTTTEPVKIVYTMDGTEPGANSTVYTGPLTFSKNTVLKIRSVLLSGKMSPVRTITLEKQTLAPAVEKTGELQAAYYKGLVRTIGELDGRTPDETAVIEEPRQATHRVGGYREVYAEDYCATVLTGFFRIPEDGVYYFSTDHEMWLDGQLFISNEKDNNGTARRFSRSDRSVALAKGYHAIKLFRPGAIFGGWPAQWDPVQVQIRKAGEPKFSVMNKSWFAGTE